METKRKNSISKIAANNRYTQKSYDRVACYFKKGEKEIIAEYAKRSGKSINSYIMDAVREKLKKEGLAEQAEPQEME